jgi:hypothetical protein
VTGYRAGGGMIHLAPRNAMVPRGPPFYEDVRVQENPRAISSGNIARSKYGKQENEHFGSFAPN